MSQPVLSRRPEAPGSPLNGDAVRLDAMRLTCNALDALNAELSIKGQPPSAQHLHELGAEIRKLAATMRATQSDH